MTVSATPETVGFIGLGMMGRPMAANLAASGVRLVVHDADAATALSVADETGARLADGVADAGRNVDAVILMLPNGTIVREVVLGTGHGDGLVDTLAAGAMTIDMSSSEPAGTQSLGREMAERGFTVMDAPVSGGVKKAVSGELAIMVGGEAAALDRVQPLLERMGARVFRVGPLGSGHAMKALNNYVSAAGLIAAADAVRVGASFGIDNATLVDILNASTGRNNSTENKFHQHILSGTFATGFSLALMAKDVGIARDIAGATGHDAPLLDACAALWREASEGDTAHQLDHTEITRFLEAQKTYRK